MMLEDPALRLDASQSLSYFEQIVLGISPEQVKVPIRHSQEDRSIWRRQTVSERVFRLIQSSIAAIIRGWLVRRSVDFFNTSTN
jgi:hypothetical protein